jgi:hypothetical protein
MPWSLPYLHLPCVMSTLIPLTILPSLSLDRKVSFAPLCWDKTPDLTLPSLLRSALNRSTSPVLSCTNYLLQPLCWDNTPRLHNSEFWDKLPRPTRQTQPNTTSTFSPSIHVKTDRRNALSTNEPRGKNLQLLRRIKRWGNAR